MVSDCTFCRIVSGDIPAQRIEDDERTIAFLDIAPAARGHALVIPRRHARDLHEIEDADLEACVRTARRVADRLRDRLGAEGVNLWNSNGRVAAQMVFHFHLHVIPRYHGDDVRHPWIPREVGGDALAAVARELHP